MKIASPDDGAATGGTVSVSKVTTASEGSTGQVSVVDAQGKIRNRWEGERDYNTFRAAVDRAMKQ